MPPAAGCEAGGGAGGAGAVSPPRLPGDGLLGGAPRRGGELAVFRCAAAGAAFPATAGLPRALPNSQTETELNF